MPVTITEAAFAVDGVQSVVVTDAVALPDDGGFAREIRVVTAAGADAPITFRLRLVAETAEALAVDLPDDLTF